MSLPNLGRLLVRPTVRGCAHSSCSPFWTNYLPFLGTAEISHIFTQHDRGFHSTIVQCAAKSKNSKKKLVKPMRVNPKAVKLTVVTIYQNMTVKELAMTLGKDIDHVFEVLMYVPGGDKYEEEESVIKDFNIIKEVVKKSGMKFQIGSQDAKKKDKENKDIVRQPPPDPAIQVKRPPVVTIMGHVDHGKTTLLDALRDSNVVDQEFGGITQHIGAFSVKLSSGEAITFLDTPGHAAFSAMRARGAQVTDIIVLVVAGDDGVMNQTRESVQHAMEANVPIIVAVNKMDRPEADLERTKKMLVELQLDLEDNGGDVQVIPISALKGTNLSLLQEAIVTQAELMELKADPKGLVEGRVVESKTDPGRGKLVTAVVQRGTLKRGDLLVAGTCWAKVRGMFNDQGKPIQEAAPSTPVELIGWKDLPSAGEQILQVPSMVRGMFNDQGKPIQEAAPSTPVELIGWKDLPSAGEQILQVPSMDVLKDAVSWREAEQQNKKLEEDQVMIDVKREEHDQLYQQKLLQRRETGRKRARPGPKQKETVTQHEGPQLSLILKGDVDGSVEAILDTLDTYHSKLCRLDLVHYGVGNVTESDVQLAEAFSGVIFGFNVSTPAPVVKAARDRSVSIRTHNVIYKLFDDLVSSLSSKLPIVQEEDVLGEAEVKAVFQVTEGRRKVAVAGCRCVRGTLHRKHLFKLVRAGEVIYDGDLSSMKHFKKEVDVVKTDVECGLSVDTKDVDFQPGDQVVCYQVREVEQEIDWQPGF